MKKQAILLLAVLTLFSACSKKNPNQLKTDWQNDELVGEVKSYKIVNYLAGMELGEVVKGEVLGSVGRIVYNEKGFRTDEYWLFNEEETHRLYTYNTQGNCTEVVYKKSNGEVEERCESKYNKNGILTDDCYYRANGELVMRIEHTFDKDGYLVEQRVFDADGEMGERHVSKYDSDGMEKEHLAYIYEDNNTMLTKQKNTYKDGLLTEATLYDDGGNKLGHWSYEYDDHRNVVKEECLDGDGELAERRTYTYRYDEKGNWIQRITYDGEENEPRVIAEREINYFK